MKTGIYKHHGGGFYQVLGLDYGEPIGNRSAALDLGVARHSETEERLVVRVVSDERGLSMCVYSCETNQRLPGRSVIYLALSGIHMPGPRMCVRPEVMFNEIVPWPVGNADRDTLLAPRFMYVGDELPPDELARVRREQGR